MILSSLKQCEGGITGLVALFSSFLTWVLAFGSSVSIGIYNLDLADHFNIGSARVSLIGSINTGILFGAGPVAGILISKWSCRKTAVAGAILSSVGLVAFVFSPNVVYSYFFYGILNGLGNCLAVMASQVSCGQHYIKHRGVTSSFVISGTGFGSCLFPIIINKLIQIYGWKGSLLFLSGINLHLLLFTLLLFPPEAPLNSQLDEQLGENMNKRRKSLQNFVNIAQHVNTTNACTETRGGRFQILLQNLKKNVRVIGNFKFLIFLASTILFNFGYNVLVIFLPQHSIAVGLDEDAASFALTLVGAGLFVGCLIGSLLGNYNCKIIVLIIGSLGFSISSIGIRLSEGQVVYMLFSFLAGVSSGLETAYLLAITCEILGDRAMSIGFGFVMFAVGVGCLIGPPVAGSLIDYYHDTSYMLYTSAVTTVLSGLVMLPYPLIFITTKCSKAKTIKLEDQQKQSTITLISVISN